MNDWLDLYIAYKSVDEMLEIIDDAITHGFEFKVENHSLLFREMED